MSQPKSSTPLRTLPLPPHDTSEYKSRHRKSLSEVFDELKVSPPRTPACRFSRVSGGWQSDDSDSENDDIVGPPAEAKDDSDNSDNDDNPHKNLNWKSERLLSIDDKNDLENDIENDTPGEMRSRFEKRSLSSNSTTPRDSLRSSQQKNQNPLPPTPPDPTKTSPKACSPAPT